MKNDVHASSKTIAIAKSISACLKSRNIIKDGHCPPQYMFDANHFNLERYKWVTITKRSNQNEIPTLKPEVGKNKLTIRYL